MRSDLVQSSGRAVRTLLLALLLTPWLLIAVFASSAAEASSQTDTVTVPQALNLRSDGIEAQAQDLVLILMLSRTDCSYCALLKREIIGPMIASGDYQDKVMIRELLLEAGFKDVSVYWDIADDDEDSDYRARKVVDNQPSWVCYLIARK